jgi:hypothetical protein
MEVQHAPISKREFTLDRNGSPDRIRNDRRRPSPPPPAHLDESYARVEEAVEIRRRLRTPAVDDAARVTVFDCGIRERANDVENPAAERLDAVDDGVWPGQ